MAKKKYICTMNGGKEKKAKVLINFQCLCELAWRLTIQRSRIHRLSLHSPELLSSGSLGDYTLTEYPWPSTGKSLPVVPDLHVLKAVIDLLPLKPWNLHFCSRIWKFYDDISESKSFKFFLALDSSLRNFILAFLDYYLFSF